MEKKINKYNGPDHWYNPKFFESLHEKPIEYISDYIKEKERVLDIGAGDGKLTYLLSELTNKVIGIESQCLPIKFAKLMFEARGIQAIPFLQGNALSLPFKKESFDMITLFDVIEHIPVEEVSDLFEEIKRVLSSMGRITITTPNKNSLRNKIWGHHSNPKHYQEYSLAELIEILHNNKFEIEFIKGIYFPIPVPKLEHYGSIFPFKRVFSFFINFGESYPRMSETIFLMARRRS